MSRLTDAEQSKFLIYLAGYMRQHSVVTVRTVIYNYLNFNPVAERRQSGKGFKPRPELYLSYVRLAHPYLVACGWSWYTADHTTYHFSKGV